MSHWKIREYSAADVPELKKLWIDVFRDREGFVAEFFSVLPQIGTGYVAQTDGQILGAAYLLTGQKLVLPDGQERSVGYIYGVCVDEKGRGMGLGSELVRSAAAHAQSMETDIICTLPAEEWLYGWYERLAGLKPALYRSAEQVSAGDYIRFETMSPGEYKKLRENTLQGKSYLSLSLPAHELEGKLLEEYGGAYLASGTIVAAVYVEEDTAIIRELEGVCGEERLRAAASIAHKLGAERAMLYSASEKGEKYIAAGRARLNFRLKSAIISSALEVAESMAVRRAACSEARLSHSAP